MALDVINTGTVANDGTGDKLRVAGAKINANFAAVTASLQALAGDISDLSSRIDTIGATPGVVVTLGFSAVATTGAITYSGTYTPANLSPAPEIIVTAVQGGSDIASEVADTVSGGAFSGSLGGLAAGSYAVRAAAPGGAVATSSAIAVVTDTTPPTATALTPPADATYGLAQTLDFLVAYDEPVVVAGGVPRLALTVGATPRYADFTAGSGTAMLAFSYAVQAGDADTDGVTVAAGVDLNGATIKDIAGNAAVHSALTGVTLAGVKVDTSGGAMSEVAMSGASPFLALRADKPATISETNGKVTGWASYISGGWSMTTLAEKNSGTWVPASNYIDLASAGDADGDADFLSIGSLGNRYQSSGSDGTGADLRLGIVYLLFRIASAPPYNACLFRIGANDSFYAYATRRAYVLGLYSSGKLTVYRGDGSISELADVGACPVGEWVAAAFVLNDDRTTEGTSDNISRLFAKTKAGGSWASMVSVATAARVVPSHGSVGCHVNRFVFGGGTSNGSIPMRVGAVYFDPQPPRGAGADAAIEANLDFLLTMV